MRSTNDIEFTNLKLTFPNATSGPFVDLSHFGTGDSTRDAFHHVAFMGPGLTVGPIINDAQTDFVMFDNWTSFSNASVFVIGPTDSSQFTDSTIFNNVEFYGPGTAAIENASASWTISGSNFGLCNANNAYALALNFVRGYNQVSNLLVTGSSVVGGSGKNCNTTVTYFSLPVVSGNAGAVTFSANLITGALSHPAQTFLSVNDGGMAVNVSGNTFSGLASVFSVGTGATLDVGPNIYYKVARFMSGTPVAGKVTDNNGVTTIYGSLFTPSIVLSTDGTFSLHNKLFYNVVPTISSGFGTNPSIATQNGTASFTIRVGTGGNASSGVVTLPSALNGWNCFAFDATNPTTGGGYNVKQTAGTTTTATLTGFNAAGVTTAWAASDVLSISCFAR